LSPESRRSASATPEPLAGLTDTHCHLSMAAFADDLDRVLERAAQAGLARILVPGIDLDSSRRATELAGGHPMLACAVGVHPHETESFDAGTLNALRTIARDGGAVAIGEIGLDYYRDLAPREKQRTAFRAQIELALELELPVIVHIREAAEDALTMLAEAGERLRGVLHAFSGGMADAERALGMGFFLGAAGPVTYPKASALREVFRVAPPDRILLETDSPYLPPQGHRGERNEPARVNIIARRLADDRGIEPALWTAQTRANADTLFHWE
jgi:TatD DNase family protein